MLGLLIYEWEDLSSKQEYLPLHDMLKAGIALLKKYYWWADDTDTYFIAHGKLSFASHVWPTFSYTSQCLIPFLSSNILKLPGMR